MEAATGYAFLLPALVLIGALAIYPVVSGVVTSLRSSSVGIVGHGFVGLANYVAIFQDAVFRQASLNTILYFAIVTVGAMIGGCLVAIWLQRRRRMRGALLALIIFPWAVPGTVSGVLWSFIFSSDGGLLNSVLQSLGIIRTPIVWFNNPTVGVVLISITLIWNVLPIVAVIVLAGLESIPRELYEQAAVDGASSCQAFRRITLSLLRPALAICLVDVAALGISIFDQIYVLGGYSTGTMSAVMRIYLYAFTNINFGQAMAASMVVGVATLAVSLVYLRVVYREVSY